MKNSLRRWAWLAATAIVLGLIFYHLRRSPEWRAFRWDEVWSTLSRARPAYLVAAVFCSWLSYLLRACRWKFFLESIKKGSLWYVFAGQVLGFTSIYLVGRPGELVRPAYIAKKENVTFTSQLALLALERIYDAVFLFLLFVVSMNFLPVDPRGARTQSILAWIRGGGTLVFALLVAGLVAFRLRADRVMTRLLGAFDFLPTWAQSYLAKFLQSFSAGLGLVRDWKSFLTGVTLSAGLWTINASVFWFGFRSLGGGLGRISWFAAAVAMFCAAQGLVLQIPGVGGGYQIGAILALTEIIGIKVEIATIASLLAWLLILVPCLALGVIILIYEGLTFRQLTAITEEQRAGVRGKSEIARDSS